MAIQMRRGNEADLDISQLKSGEIAVCTDTGKIIVKLAGENYLTLTDMPELSENFENEITALTKVVENHTHKYAGSSSVGGSATSAVKLDSSAGSATQPVYFENGKPVATTYALKKSVPADAVFTDTTYSVVSTTANGMAPKTDGSTSKFLRGDSTWAIPPNSKVTQTVTTTNASYPLLLAPSGQTATTTTTSYFDSGVTLNPSTNTIAANVSGSSASIQAESLSGLTVSLDDYTLSSGTPHIKYYYCPTDAGGSNITGRPDDGALNAFNLRVELIRWLSTTDYVTKQTYTRGFERISWERFCRSGTWSSWRQIAYTDSSISGNAATATKLATARYIDGVSFTGEANVTRYATCSTAAATAAKTASITSGTFSLITGARVTVKFTYANTVASPTLNIGSTGAKAIYWHGAALASSQYWQAGAVLDFVYNGTQWELIGGDAAASLHTHTMSQVTDLPIALLKSTSTNEIIGAALCDTNGNQQFTANKTTAGMYIYDDSGNRYQILTAAVAGTGAKLASMNGLNYITVTNDGINLYENGANIDTGWQEVTLNTTNFKAYNDTSSNAPIYRRVGNMVQIKGIISPVNNTNSVGSTTVTEIGTIPVDCAPSTLTVYAVCHGSNNAIWLLNVTPSGMIGAARYAIGETSSTPITSAWMPFSITYLI